MHYFIVYAHFVFFWGWGGGDIKDIITVRKMYEIESFKIIGAQQAKSTEQLFSR